MTARRGAFKNKNLLSCGFMKERNMNLIKLLIFVGIVAMVVPIEGCEDPERTVAKTSSQLVSPFS